MTNLSLQHKDVFDLISKIKDKSFTREQRLNASKALKNIAETCTYIEQFTPNWQAFFEDVSYVLIGKSGIENKRAIEDVASRLVCLIPYEYDWVFIWSKRTFDKIQPKFEDERAIVINILTAALESIAHDGVYIHEELILETINFAVKSLEGKLTNFSILDSLLNMLFMFHENYESSFHEKFELIISIVLSWSVEHIHLKLQQRCRDLIHISSWESHRSFGYNLLSEYISELEMNIEEYTKSVDRDYLTKNKMIIHSTSVLLEAILLIGPSEFNWALDEVHKIYGVCTSCLKKFSTFANQEVASFMSSFCIIYSKILHLCKFDIAKPVIWACYEQSLTILTQYINNDSIIDILNFVGELFITKDIPPNWSSQITRTFLDKDGIIALIVEPSMKKILFSAVINFISILITPITILQLQETFELMKATMIDSAEILIHSLSSKSLNENEMLIAKLKLCIYVNSLKKFASIKNSLIAIMGMQPSLLQFICLHLPVCHQAFSYSFPDVHYTFLKLLFVNCQSHDFFLATSEWLASTTSSHHGESISSKHAQLQLQTICKCLQNGLRWKPSRKLICDWLIDILSRIDDSLLVQLAKRKEWMDLHRAVITSLIEVDAEESLREVARRLGVFSNEHERNVAQICTAVIEKIALLDPVNGKAVRAGIDSSLFIRCSVSNTAWDNLESRQHRVPAAMFSNSDFALLSDFLLKGIAPSVSLNPCEDHLWLFDTINILYNDHVGRHANRDIGKFVEKWRWAIAQMAIYCVENRMKTTLGKATDTFNAIQVEIQRLGKVALRVVDDRKTNYENRPEMLKSPKKNKEEDIDDEEYGEQRNLSDAEEWWRIRCLLEFVEIFDKMIFNATIGAHYPLSSVSSLTRQFFHANQNSCSEWLNRTYPFAMIVAYHAGYYAQVLRFGWSALNDMEKRHRKSELTAKEKGISAPSSNSLVVIMLIGRAMAELGSYEAVKGLQKWTSNLYKIDVSWLDGVVEAAGARYETALAYLIRSLHHGDLAEPVKVHLRSMIFDILNKLRLSILLNPNICPPDISIWQEADKLQPYPSGFDADSMTRLMQLCSFAKVDQVNSSSVRWDINSLLFSKEAQLMQTLRRKEVLEMGEHISELGHLVFLTDSGQRAHGRIATIEKILSALASKMNKKYHDAEAIAFALDPCFLAHSESDMGERLCHSRKLCFWGERLEASVNHATYETTAILARKTGNYLLAEELLRKINFVSPSAPRKLLTCTFERSKMQWKNEEVSKRYLACSQTILALDQALIVENLRQQQLSFFSNGTILSDQYSHGMNGIMNVLTGQLPRVPIEDFSDLISKVCLKLARWLGTDDKMVLNLEHEVYNTGLWGQMDATVRGFGGDFSKYFMSLAVQVSPKMAKAHLQLGNWFYNAATNTYTTSGKENFINRYKAFLASVPETAFDKLWDLLFTASSISDLENEVNKLLDSSTASFFLGTGSKYIETWNQHHHNKVSLLTGAINSYFSFISQFGLKEQRSIGSVSATLRVLTLLANYSELLSSLITSGFSQTNELLWRDILPQLFSRLSHPSRLVREAIISLISKICISAPHSVVFQVVSGATSFSFMEESDDVVDSEDTEEQEDTKKEKTLMFECCQKLKDTLQETYPSLVEDVQLFINELQKISLLNEEKWTFVLSNLDHEMLKRLDQIRKEVEKTTKSLHLKEDEKTEIIAEKSKLITSSVYRILQDLYDRTCIQKPTTLNEELFIEEYGSELKRAFEQSKNNIRSPEKTWSPFRQLLSIFQQKNSRRGAQILNIQDISTVLSKLQGTSIPLPGQESCDYCDIVTLNKIDATAQILPTKTRPKKMMFTGSDGKEQIFLFKGQEDLHLDERIMQVLQICNVVLERSKRTWPSYSARHYAVTPLGPRSGLIQWVGGATPLFFLYRKWQQRQVQIQQQIDKKNGIITAGTEVERPIEMFQKTLRHAFLTNKVETEIIADRSKWPSNVLKEVLHSLIKETPKDLISRELWIKSGSSDTWWRVISRLARSTAVMSIIGAVLGLGDRHLDNLLVNLDKGEIIHIDYNICFDKGKTLRVPETVPFRLTQNLVYAMGPTQIEGAFRESCYHVLRNLRTNQEVLLTVLEAFIYDPLVDWAATDHLTNTTAAVSVSVALAVYGNDSRMHKAKPIAREMFTVRRREYKIPWLKNYGEIVVILEQLKIIIQKLINGGTAWENSTVLEQKKGEEKRKLQVVLSEEQVMMKHFRPLMKALASCDDRFAVYLKEYKEFFHYPMMTLFQLLDSSEESLRRSCLESLEKLQVNIHRVYHDILNIDTKETLISTLPARAFDITGLSPPPGLEDRAIRREQQEQNVYAQNAVKRVKARLQGETEDRMLSVEDQVDQLIRHATSSTKLSQMYEGWTAWV